MKWLLSFLLPWQVAGQVEDLVRSVLDGLPGSYRRTGGVAVHRSAAAHRNYIGNSIIGQDVNLEAGAVLANHFNERTDKRIFVRLNGRTADTGLTKFGAVLGDGTRIGANAVTTPGTLLPPHSVVGRLALVDQMADAGPPSA